MKTSFEKEKKLNDALTRLKNFHVKTDNSNSNFDILEKQKNQLEIEKKELEDKKSPYFVVIVRRRCFSVAFSELTASALPRSLFSTN